MKLLSLKYKQHRKKSNEWNIRQFSFNPKMNLIIGKNATGKSRMVNVIFNLSLLLSGNLKKIFTSSNWDIEFSNQKDHIKYSLHIENGIIQKENFVINGENKLEREESGKGKIYAEELGKKISFKISQKEVAVVKKRDSIQHPFLEDLYCWADSVRIYRFGTDLGHDSPGFIIKSPGGLETSASEVSVEDFLTRDQNLVVAVLKKGLDDFGNDFSERIKKDMNQIGYSIDSISVNPVDSIQIAIEGTPLSESTFCIYVKEQDLNSRTAQNEISAGMFRALSLIIQLNFLQLSRKKECCILIDDIGEGLDFERSTNLVKLLIEKIKEKDNFQFIMTSNDRFIMNGVPLEYWSVIDRLPGESKIYNRKNSKEIFEEFEFTGLNNFDFFASNFYKGAER